MLADALTHSMNAAIKPARIQTDTAIVLQIVGAAITGNRCGLLQRQRVRTQDQRVAQRPASLFHSGLAGPRLWLAPFHARTCVIPGIVQGVRQAKHMGLA